MDPMSNSATTERRALTKDRKKPTASRLSALPIDEGIVYLVQTYGMNEDDAREKVLIAKGMIDRDSHEVAE
jgi:hypothetical protein